MITINVDIEKETEDSTVLQTRNDLKHSLVEKLRDYGDPISNTKMHIKKLQQNLHFVENNGNKEYSEERLYLIVNLSKVINCSYIYKEIMTEPLEKLKNRVLLYEYYNTRKKLINNLIILGYKKNYLKNLHVDILKKLMDNPNPYVKSNRKELIDLLSHNYGMSPSTLKSWNFQKIKEAFLKKMSKKYGPLGEPLKAVATSPNIYTGYQFRSGYLQSLSNALFYNIIYDD